LTKFCSRSKNISNKLGEGGRNGNSLLYEVQEEGGDKKLETRYSEEW
jgi:hypothetical protein